MDAGWILRNAGTDTDGRGVDTEERRTAYTEEQESVV
jgi:hypothetical protein